MRKPHSQETKDKISKTLMGHPISDKTRKILAEKSPFKKGFTPWNKGKPWSDEMKQRISETNIIKGIEPKIKNKFPCGKNHPNWSGGNNPNPYPLDWNETLKRSIRERDNYVCFICKALQGDMAFCIHHIDYNKKNCDPKNLITLCRSCHTKTNHKRDYWINYFNELKKTWE
jgi:hypothetical protein